MVCAHVEAGRDGLALRGTDGYVALESLAVGAEGNDTVRWDVQTVETEGGTVVTVHADINASTRLLSPEDLASIVMPEVPEAATVVLSTAGPHRFRSAAALGFREHCQPAALASYVPGEGATVAWARDRSLLGSVLDDEVVPPER